MSNGDLKGQIFSWLLIEKQITAVCSDFKVKSGKSYRNWTPEILGVNANESIEVRIRPKGFLAADFVPSKTLSPDGRCSANYVFYVIPEGVQYDKAPAMAGILTPTGRKETPFAYIKGGTRIHSNPPDPGLLTEVSRRATAELSNAIRTAAALENALQRLASEIHATNNK